MASEKKERLVRIIWEGPLEPTEAYSRNGNGDYGIYQVYGQHVVFGRDSLLYIGLARDQKFGERLRQQHYWIEDISEPSIYLGRLHDDDTLDDDDWYDRVADCEQLLIFWHSPPYNLRSISSYDGSFVRIQNHGDIG